MGILAFAAGGAIGVGAVVIGLTTYGLGMWGAGKRKRPYTTL